MPNTRHTLLALGLALLIAGPLLADAPVDYTRQIKPILTRHCAECHNGEVQKGGLRLDTAAHLRQGGDSGDPVVGGNPAKSLIVEILHDGSPYPRMPYKRSPLSKGEIDLLTRWVEQGAPAPDQEAVVTARDHWSFRPPSRPDLPEVKNAGWVRNPIDRFILARLEREGLSPSPEADRLTLLRRVHLDLTGLPPTPDEIAAFLADDGPGAYEKAVDRLLQSPHYGERWGRHWLDLARYADSNGFTIDSPREIWKYRDWVIEALNADMPFDRFVVEQVAGDMLPGATQAQKIATGFHRNTLINEEGGVDAEQFRVEAVADRVATTGVVFLGLTLGCARCHDHKYDPISQKEYYQLFAFLNNQTEPRLSIATPELAEKREQLTARIEDLETKLDPKIDAVLEKNPAEKDRLKDEIAEILRLRPDQRTAEQKKDLAKYFRPLDAGLKRDFDEIDRLNKAMPSFPTTLVLQELPRPRETHVHIKGDFTRPGEKVSPGVPSVLHPLAAPAGKSQPDRLDLARWLVDPANPLVGRVTMNRIWQRYFGTGLVATENDFGTQGALPTHPDLLDWLATELVAQDWSLKRVHRLIVTSATYRQSSHGRPDADKVDPYNKLLARQNRLRLDAEIIRDNALAASGLLSGEVGGESVFPPQPEGIYAFTQVKRPWATSTGPDRYRRGLYTFFQRSAAYPALVVFDAPDSTMTCTRRVRSNTPLQALTLLNDRAFLELAGGLANRVLQEGPADRPGRIDYAFRLCLARGPRDWEAARVEQFLTQQAADFHSEPAEARALLDAAGADRTNFDAARMAGDVTSADRAAWLLLARVLLNTDEFITRE